MDFTGIAVLLLCGISANAFSGSSNGADGSFWTNPSTQQNSGRNLLISPMWSKMSQLTKGMPVEIAPMPVIVGTKAELLEAKRVLEAIKAVPEHSMDFDTNVPDDKIISVPIGVGDLAGHMPVSDSKPTEENPKNMKCETSIEELLPLLRKHPLPTLVHDSPEMILSMIQSLIPKPETFAEHPNIELLPSSKKLISLAVRNPDWVRALIDAEPSILNDMLGFSSVSNSSEAATEDPSNAV